VFYRVAFVITVHLLLCAVNVGQSLRTVTVWLIPSENAAPNDMAPGEEINARVSEFNRQLSGTNLTVLNTIDPLAMKLPTWNPEFAVPNASVVLSQKRTLAALGRFAKENNIEIRVRFITWDEAFRLLNEIDTTRKSENAPDVIQIGSTWAAHFAKDRMIMSRPEWAKDRGNWKDVLDRPASVLPYITDVRILFYWKRLPSAEPGSMPLFLNTSSWQSIIESIRDHGSAGDTIVFPTGLTLNLLHDYFPLVWAGGGSAVADGWTGQRIDLVSPKALAVPEYLARNARIEPKSGEPRRLITFPESTHEETSRIFVNGGYRVTLEPANFIDRWRQDFQKRKPQAAFWEYAGAVAPPVPFKGGSELVVLQSTLQPTLAFALADFLATDPGYTEMLADVGHLPSCRPGYGIDRLISALGGGAAGPSAQEFVGAVQKAIDQGKTYPDLDAWPSAVENNQVLEALQNVWRRTGEGDVDGLRTAAKRTESIINVRLNWFYKLKDLVIQIWGLLTVVFLGAASTIFYFYLRRLRARQELTLLLHLNRAYIHDATKFIGDNFHGLADQAQLEGWDTTRLLTSVRALSALFRDRLSPHINQIAEGQFQDLRGGSSPVNLKVIVEKAFDGAQYIFQACQNSPPPFVRFIPERLAEWSITKLPYAAVVVIEEWFLNSLWFVAAREIKDAVITVTVRKGALCICSPGPLGKHDQKNLIEGSPVKGPQSDFKGGLGIMRDILRLAYGVRARVENLTDPERVILLLPLPLRVARQLGAFR